MNLLCITSGFLCCLFLLPLACPQCSTCLNTRCHANGECIEGCILGYVGRYCESVCPSKCLQNQCHIKGMVGTVTCSDGCQPGYCGTKCSVPCPSGCETCGRSCENCNVTLCPQGRYGDNCESTCDLKFEKCDSESGNCVKCRPGYYGDECGKTCPSCLSPFEDMGYKCQSGCNKCRVEELCPAGFYGDDCKLICSGNCAKYNGKVSCNKATGECSAGCQPSYHGRICNYTCSEQCLSRICNQSTGECSAGCKPGYYGRTCNYTCSEQCVSRVCHQHNGTCEYGCIDGYENLLGYCKKEDLKVTTIAPSSKRPIIKETKAILIPIAVVGTVIICGVIVIIIFKRRRRHRNRREVRQDPAESVPLNPGLSENIRNDEEPALHITFEPSVSNTDTLISQFWKCLNTRLDLGEDENYVASRRDFSKKGPHFFLFLSVCRPKDCFEIPFKVFKDQVRNIDSHVYLIILLKPGQILNDMTHFDRGFGVVKKIYLEERCILDEGDTKTTFNELAESLKSKYRFKARETSKQNSHMDGRGDEDQLEADQQGHRCQEEEITDDPQHHKPGQKNGEKIAPLSCRESGGSSNLFANKEDSRKEKKPTTSPRESSYWSTHHFT